MENNVVVAIKEDHENLKIVDCSVEEAMIMYLGYGFITSNSSEVDMRKLTDEEKFEVAEILKGNLQKTIGDKTILIKLTTDFPIEDYLNNIYVSM